MQERNERKVVVAVFREHRKEIEFASVALQMVPPTRKALFAYNLIRTSDLRERLACVALIAYLSRIMSATPYDASVLQIVSDPPSKLYLSDEFQEPIDWTAPFREAFGVSEFWAESLCSKCGERVRLDDVLNILAEIDAPLKAKIGLAFLAGEAFANCYLGFGEAELTLEEQDWAQA